MKGSAEVIRADALALPLDDQSVDLVVTSPPYFGLRSYQDNGQHYAGQIGDEATPAEFVDALIAATAEMVRVVKPEGSIWVNLGDKYATAGTRQGGGDGLGDYGSPRTESARHYMPKPQGIPTKSLIGVPWRYAIRCIDELGLILRAEVIWAKPNGLPESVTDRVRRSHEVWFHFTKQPRYFSAVDEIRESHAQPDRVRADVFGGKSSDAGVRHAGPTTYTGPTNPLGRLPGSVWTIATQPLIVPEHLGVDHFAAFPMEWPRRIIRGWSPAAVCSVCGFLLGSSYDSGMLGVPPALRADRAQRPTEEVLRQDVREPQHGQESCNDEVSATDDSGVRRDLEAGSPNGAEERLHDGAPLRHVGVPRPSTTSRRGRTSQQRDQDGQPDRESGIAREGSARQSAQAQADAVRLPSLRRNDPDLRNALACPHCGGDSLRPAVIADPFGGTGTTATVAKALGRHGISVDLSADYCRLAEWRTNDPDQLAKAAEQPKPVKVPDGQEVLFT